MRLNGSQVKQKQANTKASIVDNSVPNFSNCVERSLNINIKWNQRKKSSRGEDDESVMSRTMIFAQNFLWFLIFIEIVLAFIFISIFFASKFERFSRQRSCMNWELLFHSNEVLNIFADKTSFRPTIKSEAKLLKEFYVPIKTLLENHNSVEINKHKNSHKKLLSSFKLIAIRELIK